MDGMGGIKIPDDIKQGEALTRKMSQLLWMGLPFGMGLNPRRQTVAVLAVGQRWAHATDAEDQATQPSQAGKFFLMDSPLHASDAKAASAILSRDWASTPASRVFVKQPHTKNGLALIKAQGDGF